MSDQNSMRHALWPLALTAALSFSNGLAAAAAATNKVDGDELAWAAASEANVAAGYAAYLQEYPKGRYASTARIKLAILNESTASPDSTAPDAKAATATAKSVTTGAPAAKPTAATPGTAPRPALPFTLSDALWQQIAQSEAFRNTPRVHTVAVEYTSQTTMQLSMFKKITSSLGARTRISSFSDSYASLTESNARTTANGQSNATRSYAVGLLLALGAVDDHGKLITQISRIDHLDGSLYPAHAGATMSVAYDSEMSPELQGTMHIEASCTLGERLSDGAAAQLAPALQGAVWPMECKTHSHTTGPYGSDTSGVGQDYLFEDLGVTAGQIGVFDMSKKAWAMPFGQTYHYDWDAGNSKTSTDVIGYRVDVLN